MKRLTGTLLRIERVFYAQQKPHARAVETGDAGAVDFRLARTRRGDVARLRIEPAVSAVTQSPAATMRTALPRRSVRNVAGVSTRIAGATFLIVVD